MCMGSDMAGLWNNSLCLSSPMMDPLSVMMDPLSVIMEADDRIELVSSDMEPSRMRSMRSSYTRERELFCLLRWCGSGE